MIRSYTLVFISEQRLRLRDVFSATCPAMLLVSIRLVAVHSMSLRRGRPACIWAGYAKAVEGMSRLSSLKRSVKYSMNNKVLLVICTDPSLFFRSPKAAIRLARSAIAHRDRLVEIAQIVDDIDIILTRNRQRIQQVDQHRLQLHTERQGV